MKNQTCWITTFCLLAPLLFTHRAWSLDQIIRPYQSIRSSSMGGVSLTTGLYDENFFGNPARALENPENRFTLVEVMAEVSKDLINDIKELTGDGDFYTKMSSTAGTNNHARAQTSMPALYIAPKDGKWGFGFGVFMSTQADVDLRNSFQINPTVYSDIGPAITIARKFLDDNSLGLGVTAHAAYRLATNQSFTFIDIIKGKSLNASNIAGQGSHIDFDFGATYRLPLELNWLNLTAGFAMNNIQGGKYEGQQFKPVKDVTGTPPAQPRTYGFGISAKFGEFSGFTDTLVALEVRDIGNNTNGSNYRLLHMGAETRFLGIFIPRIGFNQGYLGGGLGIDLKFLTLDIATYTEEMALNVGRLSDRRYAAKIALQF